MMLRIFFASFLLLVGTATSYAANVNDAPLEVIEAFAYPTLGLDRPAVSFATLKNTTNHTLTITGADAADTCDRMEIHAHTENNGVMQMQQVENFSIPARSTFNMQEHNLHFMLIGMKHPLKAGDSFNATLHTQDADKLTMHITVIPRE